MDSQPLICFYKEDQYIYSESFSHRHINSLSIVNDLAGIADDDLHVVSLSYPESGVIEVDIFTLNDYQIVPRLELQDLLKCCLDNEIRNVSFKSDLDKKQYGKVFDTIREEINSGNIYQVNLSFAFRSLWKQNSLSYFVNYLRKFQGDYFCFIPLVSKNLLSFSPELFIKKIDRSITTKPIKGTIKSSIGASKLIDSVKENAELSMVVDLLRNDLNQIADIYPSKVMKHRSLLEIGNIIHTYSEISCESSFPIEAILDKTFPGGSITGCPKKSAMDIIAKCEKDPRGHYTGSVGWVQGSDAIFNILIRTFTHFDSGEVIYNAGGGIVSDSKLSCEYDEINLKAEYLNE